MDSPESHPPSGERRSFRQRLKSVDPWLAAIAVTAVLMIVALQFASGAYFADFDQDFDEPGHLLSGLIIYDFFATLPVRDAMDWAVDYYLHYPRVSLGHFPPGFPLMEAIWWIPFGPSRVSVLLLEGLLAAVSAVLFFRLARQLSSPPIAFATTLLLLCAPITISSFSLCMADTACLLWTVLLLGTTVDVVERPSRRSVALAGLWLTCAMLTKGTGACLVPVPALAVLLAGRWRQLPLRPIAWAAGVFAVLGSAWYLVLTLKFQYSVARWGGMKGHSPWPVHLTTEVAGLGILGLAVAGAVIACWQRRTPVTLAATALAISCIGVSFVLRAMNQPRHWMVLLPALLLLAMLTVDWLARQFRWPIGAAAALAALALFPFGLVKLPVAGFQRFTSQVRLPGRMLISSNWTGEGAWIAAVALQEKRPSSVVIRASRILSSAPDNAKLILDELGVDTVLIHEVPRPRPPAYQPVLANIMRSGDGWRQCAQDGALTAWCRTKPPTVPRRPLRVDMKNRIGRVFEEKPPATP